MIDRTTTIVILIVIGLLAWWFAVTDYDTAPPVVIEQEQEAEQDAGSPGSVFQAGALVREGRALVQRANTTLDRFESEGVIVKPREPEAPVPAVCVPQAGTVQYRQPRRRLLLRRRFR